VQIKSFTVKNYRSIVGAKSIPIGPTTILVGPNNEGKSNLLRALATALRILTELMTREGPASFSTRIVRPYLRGIYSYDQDFPLKLQDEEKTGRTTLTLEFQLDDKEIEDFRRIIESSLNGLLPIKIEVGANGATTKVAKKGRGAASLTSKSAKIARFIAERLDFEYIPAIRTADSAEKVVASLIEKELATLEEDANYKKAIDRIAKLQEPLLEKLAESIRATLQHFLPTVSDVELAVPREIRMSAFRRCTVMINDGNLTPLSLKGDGVQSLAALGIMRYASKSRAKHKNLILAIEEPESHLHPKAQHELRTVISQLAQEHQVAISTHSPLFVDRGISSTNLIVQDNIVRAAKSIREVRDALGVRLSDNLSNAEIVVLVEGDDDTRALTSTLGSFRSKLKEALAEGRIVFEQLGGAGGLSYKAAMYRNQICRVRCVLDDDDAGRTAFESVKSVGLLDTRDVNFTSMTGKKDAELEDLWDVDFIRNYLKTSWQVEIVALGNADKLKWSSRMRLHFKRCGKELSASTLMKVKAGLADAIKSDPRGACGTDLPPPIRSLADGLEQDLTLLTN